MATGAAWRSPGGAHTMTVPFLRPRRMKRAPIRLIRRDATSLARCSSATVSWPSSQREPMLRRAGPTSSKRISGGVRPEARADSSRVHAPRSSPASKCATWTRHSSPRS